MTQSASNYYCQLQQLQVLSCSGEEQKKYLQGQLSTDVEQLSPENSQLSCHCDFKGKTWSIYRLIDTGSQILMLSNKSALANSLQELKKYGVFSKVSFTEQNENTSIFGFVGPQAAEALTSFFGALPDTHQGVVHKDSYALMRLDNPAPRYLLVAMAPVSAELSALMADLNNEPESEWQALDIQAGLPDISEQTSNSFVPQMMNLQALKAINFTKGCYMGQEVVARTKYLGKNKRAGFILSSATSDTISAEPGELLEAQVDDNWRRAGTILSSAISNNTQWLFAVLPQDTEVGATLRLKTKPEQQFTVSPLPYSLEED